ncbi:hypothetical protein [Sandaracinus amylolyticus]|uniref:hypothetical protein n=1 Tax=Sandaracinus amylolyticus TaxID=927083 RepID=UPI001F2FDFD6|nr:hypothetical protein [Sandaracinus amylolyticus]UJR85434.1 Hypothetical protein I5071_75140 [Sandaracinus amylolyticus]
MTRELDHHAEVRRVAGRPGPDALARLERVFAERTKSLPSATRIGDAFGVGDARVSVLVVPGDHETEIRVAGSKREQRLSAVAALAEGFGGFVCCSLLGIEPGRVPSFVESSVAVASLAVITFFVARWLSRRRATQTRALADALVDVIVDPAPAVRVDVTEDEEALARSTDRSEDPRRRSATR